MLGASFLSPEIFVRVCRNFRTNSLSPALCLPHYSPPLSSSHPSSPLHSSKASTTQPSPLYSTAQPPFPPLPSLYPLFPLSSHHPSTFCSKPTSLQSPRQSLWPLWIIQNVLNVPHLGPFKIITFELSLVFLSVSHSWILG